MPTDGFNAEIAGDGHIEIPDRNADVEDVRVILRFGIDEAESWRAVTMDRFAAEQMLNVGKPLRR